MTPIDWVTLVLLVAIFYLLWCCARVSRWIKAHENWVAEHYARNAELEKAVCQLENYTYQNPINTANIPAPSERFCKTPNSPPDGWGGNPDPDGF
jgi:hypothetical protein